MRFEPPYELQITPNADKEFNKLDPQIQERIEVSLEQFAQTGTPQPQRLSGELFGLWKLKFGGWRVFLEIEGSIVTIMRIERRDKVYKKQK
jgi:mRNA-degrading endonuclease RelE of RelBE toxin-antitoxin system